MNTATSILSFALFAFLLSGTGGNTTAYGQAESDDDSDASGALSAEPKYGTDSAKCVINLSLYYEFYKQWQQSDYTNNAVKDAHTPWRWVFHNCPLSSQNIYIHGLKMTEHRIQNETDKNKKEALIDTMMLIYDRRIEYFGREGFQLGRKGVEMYKLRPAAFETAYNLLAKSIQIEGNKTLGDVLIYYFRSAEKLVRAEKAEKSLLVDIYDKANEIIDFNLKQNAGDQKKLVSWENVKGNIELSFEPYATCEDLIAIYEGKFNESPNNVELLQKITKILDKKRCTDSELFFRATENLHRADPTAESASLMGKMYYNKKEYVTAGKYFREALELFEDPAKLEETHFFLANVYYIQKNYELSRSHCLKTLQYNPGHGSAYIMIGDMYAASAGSCGDSEIAKKAPYWAAVDKYIQARRVDASVADIATNRINAYTQQFPLKEELFFHDYKTGETYKVECWINETTTIRSSD